MLVPPDAAWAHGPPPAAAAPPRRPEPLDPEREARLRRERAHQYGRTVRGNLVAWHQRHAAKRAEAAAAQRDLWEQQRKGRLARLAERQQVSSGLGGWRGQFEPVWRGRLSPTSTPVLSHKDSRAHAPQVLQQRQQQRAASPRPAQARGAENAATPVARPKAVHPLDARLPRAAATASPQCTPAGQPQSQQEPRQAQAQGPALAPISQQPSSAASSVAPLAAADSEPARAADPLEELLAALLAAEGGGDPFSIINLYLEEQLALDAAQQAQRAQRGRHAAPRVSTRACAAPAPVLPQHQVPADDAPWQHSEPPVAQPPAAAFDPHSGAVAAAAGGTMHRWGSGVSNGEHVPANVRHRRSSSMALPPQFDFEAAMEPQAAVAPQPCLGSTAKGGEALPVGGMPAGAASDAQLPRVGSPRSMSAAAVGRPEQPPLLPEPAQQSGGGKQLYVEQWLQQSAAELDAAASVGPSSTAAYSADPDHEAATADMTALSSPHSQALQAPTSTSPPEPAVPLAAATTAPAAEAAHACAPSASSSSAFAAASRPRPSAPLPPGSSSAADGSTSLSSGAAPRAQLQPAAVLAAANAEEQATEASRQGRGHEPEASEASGAGDSELQAALSFGQLQAVAEVAEEAAAALQGPERAVAAAESSLLPSSPQRSGTFLPAPEASPAALSSGEGEAEERATRDEPPAAKQQVQQQDLQQGSGASAYSSDWDSDVEISFGEGSPDVGTQAAAAPAGIQPVLALALPEAVAGGGQPASPPVVVLAPASAGSPPGSASSQPRPRSPHHAALDDRYPNSPPSTACSAGLELHRPAAAAGLASGSRPLSPVSQGSSRPGSPRGAGPEAAAADSPLLAESTVVVHSPRSSSSSSSGSSTRDLLRVPGNPYALLQFAAGGVTDEVGPCDPMAATEVAPAQSPPGTPPPAAPLGDDAISCPGSARVDDDTVVQSGEAASDGRSDIQHWCIQPALFDLALCPGPIPCADEHVRSYLGEVMQYFWAERAEAFAAGAAPPLGALGARCAWPVRLLLPAAALRSSPSGAIPTSIFSCRARRVPSHRAAPRCMR